MRGWTYGLYGFIKRCVLIGRPEGKQAIGKLRRRWEDNIKLEREGLVKSLVGKNGKIKLVGFSSK